MAEFGIRQDLGYCRFEIQHGLGFSKIWDIAGFGMQNVLRLQTPWNLGCPCGMQGPVPLSPSAPPSPRLHSQIQRGPGALSMLQQGAQADPAYFSQLLINHRSFDRINIPSKHLSRPTLLLSPSLGKMIYSRKCSCLEKRLQGKGRGGLSVGYAKHIYSGFYLSHSMLIPSIQMDLGQVDNEKSSGKFTQRRSRLPLFQRCWNCFIPSFLKAGFQSFQTFYV